MMASRMSGMTKREFRALVSKVGGRAEAAKIMGVSEGTIKHAMLHGPDGGERKNLKQGEEKRGFIGPGRLIELMRSAGTLKEPEEKSDADRKRVVGEMVLMSPEEFLKVEILRIGECEDGFQRPKNNARCAEVEMKTRNGTIAECPPPLIGKLERPGAPPRYILIDGQHHGTGTAQAGVPIWCRIIPINSIEDARRIFLEVNMKAIKPTSEQCFHASRNPLTTDMRRLMKDFSLAFCQVNHLTIGLLGRSRVRFEDSAAEMPKHSMSMAVMILAMWTSDPRWGRDGATAFNHPKMLHALGQMARAYSVPRFKEALGHILGPGAVPMFHKRGTWSSALEHGVRRVADAMAVWIAPRINGGEPGRSASRARARAI